MSQDILIFEVDRALGRISHKHLGNLEASAFPIFPKTSLGKVYKPSQRKVTWHLEKQSA